MDRKANFVEPPKLSFGSAVKKNVTLFLLINHFIIKYSLVNQLKNKINPEKKLGQVKPLGLEKLKVIMIQSLVKIKKDYKKIMNH